MSKPPYVRTIEIRPSVYLLGCFALGIVLDRSGQVDWKVSLLVAVGFLICWLLVSRTKNYQAYALVALSLSVVFSGSFWHHGRWNWFAKDDLVTYCKEVSTPVCIRAKILGDVKFFAANLDSRFDAIPPSEKTSFRIQPLGIRDGLQWKSVAGQSNLVVWGDASQIQFGDEVEVFGQLHKFRGPTTPGNFNAREFFRAQQVLCAIHVYIPDSIRLIRPSTKFSQAAALSYVRSRFNELLWKYISPDQAGFASALLLGNRGQIPEPQREVFFKTGTSHLLAISGLHVGILASQFLLLYQLGLLRRNHALLITMIFVFFYAWLVEFRPPVVRASILLSLFCLGRLIGRSGFDFDLLAIAGVIVLTLNPADLFHLGPQLSFLAVATLVVFKPWLFPDPSKDPIEILIRNSRPTLSRWVNTVAWRFGQLVLVSLTIWLVGIPLVARQFHLVTPIACAVNPVVLFPVAIALFASMGVCILGGWFPTAGHVFGVVSSACLEFVFQFIAIMEGFEWGHWWTAGPTIFGVIGFYAVALAICIIAEKNAPRKIVAWLAVWTIFVWLLPTELKSRSNQSQAKCTFVDVGHGSSVLLQLSNGQSLLYDAGSLASSAFAADTISNLLWSQQIEHLDAIVVSHCDLDHYNAVPELLERFSVGAVFLSVPMVETKTESNARLVQILDRHQVSVRQLASNDISTLANQTRINVLLPPESGTSDNDNSDSIVLLADVEGQKILLPGDLEGNGMRMLLRTNSIDCDLVMMPHHGSKNSNPEEFLSWCRPKSVVISAGHNKLDPSVVKSVSGQCKLFTTAKCGTLRFLFSENRQIVEHFSDGMWRQIK